MLNISQFLIRVLNASVYLFVIIVAIYSIYTPYMVSANPGGININIYVNKECLGNKCVSNTSLVGTSNTALYALYIIFTILAGICFILFISNKYLYINCYIGILLFLISIATLITLIVIIKTVNLPNDIAPFNFTSGSILMIIACCFMIIKQVFSNTILRSIPKMISK